MVRNTSLSLLLFGMVWLAGCAGGSFSSIATQQQGATITSVSVACNPTTLNSGQVSQCTANVSGTGNFSTAVSWSAASGTVSSDGIYTAPSTAPASGADTITATSLQDSKKSGSSAVKVNGNGNGNGNGNQPSVSQITVTAAPTAITIAQTAQCTANVIGTGNYSSAVTWTATGGTITQSGLFTPSGVGTGSCKATSTQAGSTSVSGSASITTTAVQTAPITVTSIAVVATPASITTAQTAQCVATVAGTGAYGNGVTWTATGGTITQSGVFTPSGVGTGTCTATSTQAGFTNISGSAPIAVTNVPPTVTGITVTAAPSSINSSQSAQCTANVRGTGAFSSAVSWTATGGTITQAGVFTPSGTGTGTCTATSTQSGYTNISGSAPITVTNTAPTVTNVSVIANPTSINTGQTSQCSATVTGTGAYSNAVTWTATGGTITQSGVFTPSGTGTGTCTATSTQSGYTNISGSAPITVTNATPTVTKVTVVAAPASITTGQTSQCAATVTGTGAYSNAVTWTATDGTITPAGLFTPSGTGAGTCTATSTQSGYTNISGSAPIAVTSAPFTITSVTVSASPTSITTAQTSQCAATVAGTGSFSNAVTWTATGGTITSTGLLTPSAAGTATCTANSAAAGYSNISGSSNVTVTAVPAVTKITVVAAPASITSSQTSTCAATVTGTGNYTSAVTWTATGGTVTSGGVFTPSGSGAGTCTATSTQQGSTNISGSANITVTSSSPAITSVSLVCTPSSINTTQTSTCTPTVQGTGSFTNTVNLSISPSSGGGTLSATSNVASGTAVTFTPPATAETATITATSTQDSTKTASVPVTVTTASTGTSACSGMTLGANASLNGFVPFPSTNVWNTDISGAPLDPNNSTISANFPGDHLHPDFSSVAGGNYGIPYIVVDSSTAPLVNINVVAYADQSDVAEAPFPITAPIEGSPADCTGGPGDYVGDQHVLVVDRNTCMLYETFNTSRCSGQWSSDSETIWDLNNYEQRPWGWTSADAAGLPVFPGLVRYDEVAAGVISHALRFTMNNTRNDSNGGYFVQPASHAAGTSSTTPNVIGMRVRLKASFDISGFSASNQVILTAMKKYGMILADNGSNFYFQGAPDPRWNDSDLAALSGVDGSNFEVVQMTPSYPGWDAATAPTGAAPLINSFTASATTVAAGTAVTLTWSTTNDSYDFIDKLGGVRGGSVVFTPTATTTYTLNATNQYGRTTKQVTVVVQ